jgi:hypothetical protein
MRQLNELQSNTPNYLSAFETIAVKNMLRNNRASVQSKFI